MSTEVLRRMKTGVEMRSTPARNVSASYQTMFVCGGKPTAVFDFQSLLDGSCEPSRRRGRSYRSKLVRTGVPVAGQWPRRTDLILRQGCQSSGSDVEQIGSRTYGHRAGEQLTEAIYVNLRQMNELCVGIAMARASPLCNGLVNESVVTECVSVRIISELEVDIVVDTHR